jgi:hypothetical protein
MPACEMNFASYCKKFKRKPGLWVMPVILALEVENQEFWASLDYIARPCLKTKQNNATPHHTHTHRSFEEE